MERKWYLIDAEGKVLGRLASRIARILIGKDKPSYLPHIDGGDFVVCVNAEKVVVTGNKEKEKIYYRHSGYPGGIKGIPLERMRKEHPDRVIYYAVKGMLPKNKLAKRMLKRLKIYAGPEHPHTAQKPEPISV
ncbi:MAG TPA: 50S ribosomal protein L13 [bacterium (Candidatus Stahlbacteria)]|nr:50S ribosomal protein L13 [Candidatus Stahlbacteria bacterium]